MIGLFLLAALIVGDAQLAAAKIASYREPPYGACRFVAEQFQATPDPHQERFLIAVCDPTIRRISQQACAGPGKTTGLSWAGWYFLGTQCTPGEHPNGLATSITGDNLRDNLWKEFAKWQARSEYLRTAFTWSGSRIFAKDHPATWFLAARNWPKSGSADEQGRTFSGLHGANVLVLIDESGAIPSTILRAAEQAVGQAAHFGLLAQAGNPISLEGMLYEAATRLRHQWHIIVVTGDPDDPTAWVHAPRVAALHRDDPTCDCPRCWARGQIQTYGRSNPWVMSYILGKFPPASINALLSLEDVEAAIARELHEDAYAHMQKRIGVDVARFGDDRTVLWPRQGLRNFRPVVLRGADTNEIVGRIMMSKARWRSELELVDNSFAWGNGVLDNLFHAGQHPHAVNFAGPPIDKRYKNRRAEGWITMAEAIKRGAKLPDGIPELHAELTTPTYLFHNGVFQLEEKDQVKKRLGRSPDLGDACALTYMLPDVPAGLHRHTAAADGASATHAATEYDPLART